MALVIIFSIGGHCRHPRIFPLAALGKVGGWWSSIPHCIKSQGREVDSTPCCTVAFCLWPSSLLNALRYLSFLISPVPLPRTSWLPHLSGTVLRLWFLSSASGNPPTVGACIRLLIYFANVFLHILPCNNPTTPLRLVEEGPYRRGPWPPALRYALSSPLAVHVSASEPSASVACGRQAIPWGPSKRMEAPMATPPSGSIGIHALFLPDLVYSRLNHPEAAQKAQRRPYAISQVYNYRSDRNFSSDSAEQFLGTGLKWTTRLQNSKSTFRIKVQTGRVTPPQKKD